MPPTTPALRRLLRVLLLLYVGTCGAQLLASESDGAKAANDRAKVHVAEGRFAEALVEMRAAAAAAPDSPRMQNRLCAVALTAASPGRSASGGPSADEVTVLLDEADAACKLAIKMFKAEGRARGKVGKSTAKVEARLRDAEANRGRVRKARRRHAEMLKSVKARVDPKAWNALKELVRAGSPNVYPGNELGATHQDLYTHFPGGAGIMEALGPVLEEITADAEAKRKKTANGGFDMEDWHHGKKTGEHAAIFLAISTGKVSAKLTFLINCAMIVYGIAGLAVVCFGVTAAARRLRGSSSAGRLEVWGRAARVKVRVEVAATQHSMRDYWRSCAYCALQAGPMVLMPLFAANMMHLTIAMTFGMAGFFGMLPLSKAYATYARSGDASFVGWLVAALRSVWDVPWLARYYWRRACRIWLPLVVVMSAVWYWKDQGTTHTFGAFVAHNAKFGFPHMVPAQAESQSLQPPYFKTGMWSMVTYTRFVVVFPALAAAYRLAPPVVVAAAVVGAFIFRTKHPLSYHAELEHHERFAQMRMGVSNRVMSQGHDSFPARIDDFVLGMLAADLASSDPAKRLWGLGRYAGPRTLVVGGLFVTLVGMMVVNMTSLGIVRMIPALDAGFTAIAIGNAMLLLGLFDLSNTTSHSSEDAGAKDRSTVKDTQNKRKHDTKETNRAAGGEGYGNGAVPAASPFFISVALGFPGLQAVGRMQYSLFIAHQIFFTSWYEVMYAVPGGGSWDHLWAMAFGSGVLGSGVFKSWAAIVVKLAVTTIAIHVLLEKVLQRVTEFVRRGLARAATGVWASVAGGGKDKRE